MARDNAFLTDESDICFKDMANRPGVFAPKYPKDNPLYSKLNSARYTVTDEETLKKLTGLK